MATVFLEYGVDFWAVGALPLGICLELALGGLSAKSAPTQAIGRLVELAEGGLRVVVARRKGGPRSELVAGLVLSSAIVGFVGCLVWLTVEILAQFGGPVNLIGRAVLIAWGLSFRRLGDEVRRVSKAPDLATARRAALAFVRLDAAKLDRSGLDRACVEGLGERSNGEVFAPFFWLAMAGPGGLWSYRAIEILGRMMGERGPRHRYFGFASARLDDLARFVPARLTWLLIALSAALLGEDGGGALRFGLEQGRRNPGRPGAWGKAALVAALGIQPGGENSGGPIEARIVRRASRVVLVAGLHAAALALAYRIVVMGH